MLLRLRRGGGGMESGRARASTEVSASIAQNAGGRGELRVTTSLMSCAIQSTSSETSDTMETMELLREGTGSPRSGMDCMKKTEAC